MQSDPYSASTTMGSLTAPAMHSDPYSYDPHLAEETTIPYSDSAHHAEKQQVVAEKTKPWEDALGDDRRLNKKRIANVAEQTTRRADVHDAGWAAQAGLRIPSGSNPTVQKGTGDTHPTAQEGTDDLHTTDTSHCGDTHPTGHGGTLCLPSSSPLGSTPPSYFPTISSIMKHYNAACVFNNETHKWSVPVTPHLDLEDDFPWSKMLDFGPDFPPGHFFQMIIVSKVPTFYLDEPDANQQNRPRLDILISFHDGATVRYHPKADLIWSWTQQPTTAMQKRYNLGTNLERKLARARR
jgi:hypothetical protein